MTAEIRRLAEAQPFIPFKVHTADGGVLHVPTVDHIAISPSGKRVIVFYDDDTCAIVSPLLIARLTVDGPLPMPSDS